MILTDGTNTFTCTDESITEEIVGNNNVSVTLGGIVKNQADSQRLKIESKIRLKQTDWPSLNTILTNYSATKYYTPTRLLAYKSSITALSVVISEVPKIDQRVWNGAVYFYCLLKFEEVIA